ncbi:MAG: zinc ribbon domain-containing protein [Desulfovibrionaceae bacterium]|nr:zinc ribbon domain-containing protein [Desulfovibrionaceae bacterium]
MPLFEYRCKKCGHVFEELIFGDEIPPCPVCKNAETERQMPLPTRHYAPNETGEFTHLAPHKSWE